jgi:hypothetical protein
MIEEARRLLVAARVAYRAGSPRRIGRARGLVLDARRLAAADRSFVAECDRILLGLA